MKEKALELIEIYRNYENSNDPHWAVYTEIDMAIIAVDLILSLPGLHDGRMMTVIQEDYDFWKGVKTELEKVYEY